MIKENIKVEYLENTKTHKMGFTLDEIAEPGQPGWQVDYREYTSTFTNFTNQGWGPVTLVTGGKPFSSTSGASFLPIFDEFLS